MLNKADVAVSLKSNSYYETTEGANNSIRQADFTIGQFKHLKNLLLFHGRENYRKNSYLIFSSIYKNLMMTLPIFLYGIYSGFSDKNNLLYNESMYFYFDLIFTLLPVLIYAIQD